MWEAVLIVLNIPVYLFIAWLVFDTKESAAETCWETIVALLGIILVPRIVRQLTGLDDASAIGILPILVFLIACALLTYGEYSLLEKLVFTS